MQSDWIKSADSTFLADIKCPLSPEAGSGQYRTECPHFNSTRMCRTSPAEWRMVLIKHRRCRWPPQLRGRSGWWVWRTPVSCCWRLWRWLWRLPPGPAPVWRLQPIRRTSLCSGLSQSLPSSKQLFAFLIQGCTWMTWCMALYSWSKLNAYRLLLIDFAGLCTCIRGWVHIQGKLLLSRRHLLHA